MNFASVTFLTFFASIIISLSIVQYAGKSKYDEPNQVQDNKRTVLSKRILLIASYLFYGWWDWRFCFLLFGVTFISWISAFPKEECLKERKNRIRWKTGIIVILCVLALFKYFNFFIESFCRVWNIDNIQSLHIILPVGISFYTFQALSYSIDVYRGKVEKESDFWEYALYISFFPQLVAGPIIKAADFLPQLKEKRRITWKGLESGIQIFLFGMLKKLVLADNLSVFVDEVYRTPSAFHTVTIWLAVISYSIQIYLDFSGYSDMAIGCAKCLGYDFSRNFNLPYLSKNISEFWKRWHISLSSWLQEYLYIPLGGNRKGKRRTYINLMITMLLGGLWHGASWTFVLWGGIHGAALCIDKVRKNHLQRRENVVYKCLGIIGTSLFVTICWVFFRATTFENAIQVLKGLFVIQNGILHLFSWSLVAIGIIFVAYGVAIIRSKYKKLSVYEGFYPIFDMNTIGGLTIVMLAVFAIIGFAYVQGNPFIYFQF